MRLFKKLAVISMLLLASPALQSCEEASHRVYESVSIAPSFANLKGEKLYDILGPTLLDDGVNFAVYAKNATRVEVLIFDSSNPDTDLPLARIPMVKDEQSGIWTKFVYGLGVGTYYGYIAFGPNWPYDPDFYPGTSKGYLSDCDAAGNRYNPNKLLMDPYARRIHRDFDWMSGGNPASGTARDVSDWKSSPKSVVIKSEYQWSANEKIWRENRMKGDNFVGHAQNDLIFYEVHPKGFTKKAVKLNFADLTPGDKLKIDFKEINQGTWRGIGDMAPYLADLGITAVELLPPCEKPDDGTYWGYNTIQFFAPEQRFATGINQKKDNGVHDEFKEMVDKLHQNGVEVILDIVYNHTGEGGFWQSKEQDPANSYGSQSTFNDKTAATLYSFRGLDNKAYYHLGRNHAGVDNQIYLDETGVGNQMRTNVLPFRRFIVDNLRFWVEEMHVDGFRFDLASILGVDDDQVKQDGDYSSYNNEYWAQHVEDTVIQDIIDDDVMAKYHTRFIAEPWSLSQYANGLFPKSKKHENHAWFEWNGRYRDMIRPFVNYDDYGLNKSETVAPYWANDMNIGNLMTGSSNFFGSYGQEKFPASSNRKPYNSVNFLTAHDGFTLYDVATYDKKNNMCSVINQVCCYAAYNSFCEYTSGDDNNHSRDWCGGESKKDSQGTCWDANAEAYKRQILRNYFAFLFTSHGSPMMLGGDEFMRTQFGNNNAYSDSSDNEWNWFRWGDWLATTNPAYKRMHDFVRDMIKIRKQYKEFLSPMDYDSTGLQWRGEHGPDDAKWDGKHIAQYYKGTGATPSLFIIYNMDPSRKTYSLPEDGQWKILVDTQTYFESSTGTNTWFNGERTISGSYEAAERSVVILSK